MAADKCRILVPADCPLLVLLVKEQSAHVPFPLIFHDEGHQLAQDTVTFGQGVIRSVRRTLYRKRAEPDAVVLAEHIKGAHAVVGLKAYLGNEQRIVGQPVLGRPVLKARIIQVGSQQVNARSGATPYIYQMCQRPCRRIFSRLAPPAVHRRIHIHRQIICLPSLPNHALHISGVMPCHEYLIGINVRAEHFLPAAFRLAACLLPSVKHPRMQRLLVVFQIFHQSLRHRSGKQPVRLFGTVARLLQHADFILHLHHYHRMLPAVRLRHMPHQPLKRPAVRLKHIF